MYIFYYYSQISLLVVLWLHVLFLFHLYLTNVETTSLGITIYSLPCLDSNLIHLWSKGFSSIEKGDRSYGTLDLTYFALLPSYIHLFSHLEALFCLSVPYAFVRCWLCEFKFHFLRIRHMIKSHTFIRRCIIYIEYKLYDILR